MNYNEQARQPIKKIPAYVPGKPIEEVQRELGLESAIKMASNENPLGPSTEARMALQENFDKIAYYPDANNFKLKTALAAKLEVLPEQLFFGNGSDDVNKVLGETLLNPDDEVLIPIPTFSQYNYIALLMGAKPILVSSTRDDYGNDLAALRRAVTDRTKMIFVCNPNNPTGTAVSPEELRSFVDSIPKHIAIIIDEAYFEFSDGLLSGIDLIKEGYKNVIVYRTFSKIYGLAGLRLGYAVADVSLVELMNRVREPFNVNLLAQAAGIASINSKKHVLLTRELVKGARQYFYEELDELGLKYIPSQANFILIDCGTDSKEIYEALLRKGIIIRATHSFGLPNHLRITFGTAEQNAQFFKHFKEVLNHK